MIIEFICMAILFLLIVIHIILVKNKDNRPKTISPPRIKVEYRWGAKQLEKALIARFGAIVVLISNEHEAIIRINNKIFHSDNLELTGRQIETGHSKTILYHKSILKAAKHFWNDIEPHLPPPNYYIPFRT